jgi:hypothetical protein
MLGTNNFCNVIGMSVINKGFSGCTMFMHSPESKTIMSSTGSMSSDG